MNVSIIDVLVLSNEILNGKSKKFIEMASSEQLADSLWIGHISFMRSFRSGREV